jgi:hypothetical protein
MNQPRRFPPPWTVVQIEGGFSVTDSNGIVLAYVYARDDMVSRSASNAWLSTEEAWRIANGIAKLPGLLRKD